MAHSEWRMAQGAWRMAHSEWRMAHGAWRMAHGAQRMAHGTCGIAHCAWCMIHDAHFSWAWRTAHGVQIMVWTAHCSRARIRGPRHVRTPDMHGPHHLRRLCALDCNDGAIAPPGRDEHLRPIAGVQRAAGVVVALLTERGNGGVGG
eukprot:354733-Chlamydomonas_euryale.AAC.2